jgi:hypothetical protein
MRPLPDGFAAAVGALHRVAEEVVAPARKPDNEIALAATPGGFGTPVFEWEGSLQQVRVEGASLIYERREPLDVDPDAAAVLADWYALGDDVLRALGGEPVLWPEHFDIGISVDEVNYGVSPGDEHIPEPYAYVGPWTARSGSFWNMPFGATRPMQDLPDAAAVEAFFREGAERAANDPARS